MGTLKGKNAVVTGSTSGIGLAYARAFAAAGANVVINGMGVPADIERERSGIETDFKVRAVHSPADMTKPAEIAEMIALGEKTFGSVDILVNNAGIQFVAPIEEFPIEKWDAIIAINLSSAFHGIRAAVPGMKKRGWGRIINTASAHSLVASPFKSAYVSAKHGIAGLTKTVALELATFKITCNCISPGYVWTPLVEHQIPETMKARNMTKEQVIKDVLLDAQPTKEFVTSEQVAALALFLCGDDAAQITGANLSIDGGATLGMQQRPHPASLDSLGDFCIETGDHRHYRAFAACRLLGRRQDPGTAVYVSRHGAARRHAGFGRGGDHDLAVPPEQRPRHCHGRSRTDEARRAAVPGDGGPQQDGPQCEGSARQAAGRLRLSGDGRRRKHLGRLPHPGGSLLRLAGLAAAQGQYAQKRCHKIGHRGDLCSKHQIQGVLDAHPCINLKQVRFPTLMPRKTVNSA